MIWSKCTCTKTAHESQSNLVSAVSQVGGAQDELLALPPVRLIRSRDDTKTPPPTEDSTPEKSSMLLARACVRAHHTHVQPRKAAAAAAAVTSSLQQLDRGRIKDSSPVTRHRQRPCMDSLRAHLSPQNRRFGLHLTTEPTSQDVCMYVCHVQDWRGGAPILRL